MHSGAEVNGAVLMHGVDVGRGARVGRAILDKNVVIWPGAEIGLDADLDRGALLLEQVSPGGRLRDLVPARDAEATAVLAGLMRRLHVPPVPGLPTVLSQVDALDRHRGPVPADLVAEAAALMRSLCATAPREAVLHGDLHHDNVLRGTREPWLAIAPAPVNGDPHFEVAPLLWHRWDELAGDVRRGVRARFHAAIDAAMLDEERARDWVIVRAALRAAADPGQVTRCIAIAKSVQD